MKIDCGPTWAEKYEASKQWHKVFAWWPTRLGSHDCRWLEYIERRLTFNEALCFSCWEYRATEGKGASRET